MKPFSKTLFGCALGMISHTALADRPFVGDLYIRQIAHAGSGCPVGSILNQLSEDEDSISIQLGDLGMVAQSGWGVPLSESRKACQLLIDLVVPSYWQYRVKSLEYSGYAELDSGDLGRVKATTYFQGQATQASASASVYGPFYDYFHRRVDFAQGVWSPCGRSRALNIKMDVRAQSSSRGGGVVALDGPLGLDPQSIILEFRRC